MENKEVVMRIKMLIESKNVSPSGFAKLIGFNQSNFSKVLRGERVVPTNLINAICDGLNVPYKWLINGEGSMFTTGDITQSGNGNNVGSGGADEKAAKDIVNLGGRVAALEDKPVVSYTHGRPYFNVDFLGGFDIIINDQTVLPEYNIDFKPYNKEGVMWCNITGHSMEPLVSNGDIIAIKEMKDWRDFILYGEVYGIVTEDMRTVKVVTKSEQGQDFMRLVPINKSEEYQPQDIPVKLVTHVFKVVGCMKKMW